MAKVTFDEIVEAYEERGEPLTDSEQAERKNNQEWIDDCCHCAVCGILLLHDDEAYCDEELDQTLCDGHSVFDESDEMYKRVTHESFEVDENEVKNLEYNFTNQDTIKVSLNGKYLTNVTVWNENDKENAYILINHYIVRVNTLDVKNP